MKLSPSSLYSQKNFTNYETTNRTTPSEKSYKGCPPSTQSSLCRARRKLTPPLPKAVADTTLEGKPFLLLDDNFYNNRIIAFATQDNLQDSPLQRYFSAMEPATPAPACSTKFSPTTF